MRNRKIIKALANLLSIIIIVTSVNTGTIYSNAIDNLEYDVNIDGLEATKNEQYGKVDSTTDSEAEFIGDGDYYDVVEEKSYDSAEQSFNMDCLSALPASYSSVSLNNVTSVKNQGSYGCCWAFAACATVESAVLANGLYDGEKEAAKGKLDYSERAMAYNFYHRMNQDDKLHNTLGDYTTKIDGNWKKGGNNYLTAWYLSNWEGPVLEDSSNAYSGMPGEISPEKYFDSDIHIAGFRYFDANDTDAIKQHIMDNGAVMVSYYSSGNFRDKNDTYQYNPEEHGTDHALTIVGWDDNVLSGNFTTKGGVTPKNNGAWLIKNSWGTGIGDAGYQWYSYEDKTMSTVVGIFVEKADNYNNYFYYGGATGITSTKPDEYSSQKKYCYYNIYTNKLGCTQELKAVGFGVNLNKLPSTTAHIQVYANPTPGVPESGIPMLPSEKTVDILSSGYYTVDIAEEIKIYPTTKFSISVYFDDNVSFYCDKSSEQTWISWTAATEKEQSYINDFDLGGDTAGSKSLRINAYTNNYVSEPIDISSLSANAVDKIYTSKPLTTEITLDCGDGVKITEPAFSASYEDNINAGKAKVTITGNSEYGYTGSQTLYFNIEKAEATIAAKDITVFKDNIPKTFEYEVIGLLGTDKLIKEPVVVCDVTEKSPAGDYDIIIKDPGDAGPNYTLKTKNGLLTLNPDEAGEVLEEDLDKYCKDGIPSGIWIAGMPDDDDPYIYDGKAKTCDIRVYDYNSLLVRNKDYKLSFKNNRNACEDKNSSSAPVVIIKGQGNYSGTYKESFVIMRASISENCVAPDVSAKEGTDISKIKTFLHNEAGKLLKNGQEYKVSIYKDDQEAVVDGPGVYSLVYTGIGNYKGETRANLHIISSGDALDLSKIKVSGFKKKMPYDSGSAVTQYDLLLSLKDGTELQEGVDYELSYANNTEIGTAALYIIGLGGNYNLCGTKKMTYKITGTSIKKYKVAPFWVKEDPEDEYPFVYTGEEITPDVTVYRNVKYKEDGETWTEEEVLSEGSDYELVYLKNVNAGKATVIIKGIGYYSGTIKKSFTIKKAAISNCNINLEKTAPYVKGGAVPSLTITDYGCQLVEGKDYTIKTSANKKLGDEGNVVIKGKGNYAGVYGKGEDKLTFTVTERSLADQINPLTMVLSDVAVSEKDNYWQARPQIKDSNGKKLEEGVDYENPIYKDAATGATITGNVAKGTVIEVTVNGIGAYKDTISGNYTVVGQLINKAKVSPVKELIYDSSISLTSADIDVYIGKTKLTADTDYIVSECEVNRKTKSVSLTIVGIGEYGGSKKLVLKTKSKSM